jgi:hypothetical protein
MPASLATRENLEQLKQQFPRALAWGHASSQGRVNVNTEASTVHVPAIQGAGEDEVGPSKLKPRVAWLRKPDTLVTGPMWSG